MCLEVLCNAGVALLVVARLLYPRVTACTDVSNYGHAVTILLSAAVCAVAVGAMLTITEAIGVVGFIRLAHTQASGWWAVRYVRVVPNAVCGRRVGRTALNAYSCGRSARYRCTTDGSERSYVAVHRFSPLVHQRVGRMSIRIATRRRSRAWTKLAAVCVATCVRKLALGVAAAQGRRHLPVAAGRCTPPSIAAGVFRHFGAIV